MPFDEGSADGTSAARFNKPVGLAVAANGDLYIADSGNNTIRKISGGVVSTVAGNPAQAGFAGLQLGPLPGSLNEPSGLAFIQKGSKRLLLVADEAENSIVSIVLP